MNKSFCGIGLAGFICSIVCWFVFGWILSITGIILSAVGLYQCNTQYKSGKGFCVAGLIIGIIAILYMLISIITATTLAAIL